MSMLCEAREHAYRGNESALAHAYRVRDARTTPFAPGSLDSTTTAATFELDTDADSTTGGRGLGVGAEYLVDLHAGPVRGATITRATTDAGCSSPCRYAPIQRLEIARGNDAMEAVVPRSTLAPFSGPLNFRVVAHANLEGGRRTITTDHLPNLPAKFITVR